MLSQALTITSAARKSSAQKSNLSRINIKVYEGDENGNLVFEGGAAECLAWADGYCGDC